MAVDISKGNEAAMILTSGPSGIISALFSLRVLKSLWLLLSAFVLLFRGRKRMVSPATTSGSKDEKVTDYVNMCLFIIRRLSFYMVN